jgi:hypothetical protein
MNVEKRPSSLHLRTEHTYIAHHHHHKAESRVEADLRINDSSPTPGPGGWLVRVSSDGQFHDADEETKAGRGQLRGLDKVCWVNKRSCAKHVDVDEEVSMSMSTTAGDSSGTRNNAARPDVVDGLTNGNKTHAIDINVIEPTPCISPCESLPQMELFRIASS